VAIRETDAVTACGYCLQGCLHRVKNGQPIGCNLNPEIGQPEMEKRPRPLKVLVAGGGPAGLSAAVYLAKRGHRVTLADQGESAGRAVQPGLAGTGQRNDEGWPGPSGIANAQTSADAVLTGQIVDADLVREIQPDLLVWATGAHQRIPDIEGRDSQYTMTSLEYFEGVKPVKGPRVLVIGAGRTGLEIAEKLGAGRLRGDGHQANRPHRQHDGDDHQKTDPHAYRPDEKRDPDAPHDGQGV
jgi:NADPH-dependent 2,4-dienoyl-CoA reductase/sulfur reductase-like enzyme